MYLASLYIKDAFQSGQIFELHRTLFKFVWLNISYQFHSMPDGFIDSIRVFTKLSKPLFYYFREQEYSSVVYVDDTPLVEDTYAECIDNLFDNIKMPPIY